MSRLRLANLTSIAIADHLEQSSRIIIERNQIVGAGLSSMGNDVVNFYGTATEMLWFSHNKQWRQFGADHEMMTLDGGGGMYWGPVALSGRTATLARETNPRDYSPKMLHDFSGAWFGVLSGAGAGQFARVAANTNTSIELDRDLEHPLDDTSMVSVVPYRGNLFFVANEYEDGGPFQLYGMSQECIVAENTGARMDGFSGSGLNPHGWGWQPNWFNIFADNQILEGNALGGKSARFAAGGSYDDLDHKFGIPSQDNYSGNLSGPLNVGVVFRRNHAKSNARFSIDGSTECALLERNRVEKAPVGIHVTNRTAGVFLVGNEFEDVHQHFCWDTPAMHGPACYHPPRMAPPGDAGASDEAVDPLTGVRLPAWRRRAAWSPPEPADK